MSREIKGLIRQKANLWNRYKMSGKRGSVEEYRECAKRVRKGVKEAIKSYELVIISKAKDNPKLLYAYINSRQQTKESIRSIKSKNGEIVTDRKEIASILNRQFKSVFIVDDNNEMPAFNKQSNMVFEGDIEAMFGLESIEEWAETKYHRWYLRNVLKNGPSR